MWQDGVMRRLVLASTSPYRRALLDRLGIGYEVMAPHVDEGAFREMAPREMAIALATAKAEAVDVDDALVIGSDQVVDVGGIVLGKPGTVERAVEQLTILSGCAHQLITAVAVRDTRTGETTADVDVHTLTMRVLSRPQIERYVAHDLPLDCAGAYKLEQRGIALFEHIAADPSTAVCRCSSCWRCSATLVWTL